MLSQSVLNQENSNRKCNGKSSRVEVMNALNGYNKGNKGFETLLLLLCEI